MNRYLSLHRGTAAFLAAALVVLSAIYFGRLFPGPYIDDNVLIFTNPFILSAQNPLLYWLPGQESARAWPLTHTLYWLFFRLFHWNFWAYRIVNLLLHWANGAVLFSLLSKRTSRSSAAFAAALFWLHPLAVESVTWISQLSTLLTTLFFAFWFSAFEKGASLKKSLLWLVALLATKGFAYFLPVLNLRKRLSEVSWRRAVLEQGPLVLIAAYGVFIVFSGISSMPEGVLPGNPEATKPGRAMAELAAQPLSYWYSRVTLCGQTAVFYFFRLFAYLEIPAGSLRPANLEASSAGFFLLGLGVLASLIWCIFKRSYILAAGILLYLPASGLFPVSFLKYSLVGDRMIYPTLYVFSLGIGLLYDRQKNIRLRQAFWLWPLLLGATSFLVARVPQADFSYMLSESHR